MFIERFRKSKKIGEDYLSNISNFGKKTFTDTMNVINNFIK